MVLSFALAGIAQTTTNLQSGQPIQTRTKVAGSWTTGFYTRYFAAGNGIVIADEPVVQSEFDIDWARGKFSGSFMIRGSKGFKSNWNSYSDEVDLGTSLTFAGPVELSGSFWHIALVPVAQTDVQYFELKVAKPLSIGERDTITPSARLDYFRPTGSAGPRAGKIVNGGLRYVHTITQRISMSNEVHLMRDIDGAFGLRPNSNLYSYGGAVDLKVGRGWTLIPKITIGGTFIDPTRPTKVTFAFEAKKTFTIRDGN